MVEEAPEPTFGYDMLRSGEVVISRNGEEIMRLVGTPAGRFVRRIAKEDPQRVMARMTQGRSGTGRRRPTRG